MMANRNCDSASAEGKLRVLVVEADHDQAEGLVNLLEPRGYQVAVAHNIEETHLRLDDFDAQVAVIALRLGKESGIDLVREFQQSLPEMKCVLLTAYADLESTIEAFKEGVFDFLRKPINPASLFVSMDRCVEQILLERDKVQSEAARKREKDRLFTALNLIPGFVYLQAKDHSIPFANDKFKDLFGDPGDRPCYEVIKGREKHCEECPTLSVLETGTPRVWEWTSEDGRVFMIHDEIFPGVDGEDDMVLEIAIDITDRKRAEEALEKRIVALTQPLEESDKFIDFGDLFNIDEIQHIQDLFAEATGVASIITHIDGTPITRPSNFCRLCKDIIRKTPKGLKNCLRSDEILGRHNPDGPIVQRCLSCGLWDAGASITVGGKHLANWLIGQVRNEAQDEQLMVKYAREIGADEDDFRAAFQKVPVMANEQFQSVARMLFAVASQMSTMAYQNVQQARFITARKQAEDELRQSEHRFRTLVEQAADAFYLSDPSDGGILDVNRQACESLGYTRAELLSMRLADIDVEVERESHKERFWDKIVPGHPVTFEGIQRRKDGTTFPVEISCDLIQIGQEMRMAGLTRDVTERKEAEEQLQRERDFSAQIINSLPGLFYVFDEEKFVKWNPKWEATTGYTSEELAKLYGPDFFEGADKQIIADRMGDVFREGTSQAEAEFVMKDGRKIPFFFTGARCIFDGVPHLVGLGIDITQRKRIEAEREQLIAKLEAQNAELERFTYTVSHDLKSPLITVKCFVGMMREDLLKGDDNAVNNDLVRIASAADKMDQLLKELLELSRIGRLHNPSVEIPLEELAKEAVELAHGQIVERGVEVEISPNLPVLYGDRIRLREVVQNLVDNAVKYSGDQPNPRIEICCRHENDETICCVRDNGIGIDPSFKDKIFGLFEQLDQKAEGSGVGLALVKRIIEVHDGRIWVESKGIGQGSTFCFTIAEKTE